MINKVKLNNKQLIERCKNWITNLCKSGGGSWTLSVPVNFENDPDMLLTEVISRFEKTIKWIDDKEKKPESFKQVLVFGNYIGKNYMAEFVSCGNWQSDHWSTDRDGWPDLDHLEITHWAEISLPDNPNMDF